MTVAEQLPLSLVVKLASVVVHAQEATADFAVPSKGASHFDMTTINGLVNDPEVVAWLATIDPALLPVKRKVTG